MSRDSLQHKLQSIACQRSVLLPKTQVLGWKSNCDCDLKSNSSLLRSGGCPTDKSRRTSTLRMVRLCNRESKCARCSGSGGCRLAPSTFPRLPSLFQVPRAQISSLTEEDLLPSSKT